MPGGASRSPEWSVCWATRSSSCGGREFLGPDAGWPDAGDGEDPAPDVPDGDGADPSGPLPRRKAGRTAGPARAVPMAARCSAHAHAAMRNRRLFMCPLRAPESMVPDAECALRCTGVVAGCALCGLAAHQCDSGCRQGGADAALDALGRAWRVLRPGPRCPVRSALLCPPGPASGCTGVSRDGCMKSGRAASHRHAPGEPYPKSARNSKGGEGRVSSGTCLWEPKVAKPDGTSGVTFSVDSTGSTGGPIAGRDGLFAAGEAGGALPMRYSRLPGALACHQSVMAVGLAYGEKSHAARTSSMSGGRESGCCRSLV